MTPETYARMQDSAAFGDFLVDVIADLYGCDHTAASVERAVYKNTECGAWCKFDESGILVGTIIEGSDAEYQARIDMAGLDCDEESATLLTARFRAAIQECEDFAA